MKITLRSTEVFEQIHPLAAEVEDPHAWGPAHEAAYGRTFDALVQQGHKHDPNTKPAFDIVECPEELRVPKIHSGWSAGE